MCDVLSPLVNKTLATMLARQWASSVTPALTAALDRATFNNESNPGCGYVYRGPPDELGSRHHRCRPRTPTAGRVNLMRAVEPPAHTKSSLWTALIKVLPICGERNSALRELGIELGDDDGSKVVCGVDAIMSETNAGDWTGVYPDACGKGSNAAMLGGRIMRIFAPSRPSSCNLQWRRSYSASPSPRGTTRWWWT